MAVQLMPESAVCLLMVSLGGRYSISRTVSFLSLFLFLHPPASEFSLSLSSHCNGTHRQRGRSRAFILLMKGDVAPLLLPFTTSPKIPRTTFQPGSEAEPGSNGTLKLLQWVEKLLTGGFKARRLIHETRVTELRLLPVCAVCSGKTFDQLHLRVKQKLWLHV